MINKLALLFASCTLLGLVWQSVRLQDAMDDIASIKSMMLLNSSPSIYDAEDLEVVDYPSPKIKNNLSNSPVFANEGLKNKIQLPQRVRIGNIGTNIDPEDEMIVDESLEPISLGEDIDADSYFDPSAGQETIDLGEAIDVEDLPLSF